MECKTCIIYFCILFLSHNGNFNAVTAETTAEEIIGEQQKVYHWRQYDYTGTEEIDMTSLESVFYPVILTSELHGDHVKITMSYTERITSTPFWQMKFDGVSYTITQGNVVRSGTRVSTTIDLPVSWKNYQFLAFSLSSDMGIYYIELNYDALSERSVDMSVPRMGMKMTLPKTFKNEEFPVKLEKDSSVNETCFTFLVCKALLRTVDKAKEAVERLHGLGVYTKNKTDQQQVNVFDIMDDYLDYDSEVVVFSYCSINDMVPPRWYHTLGVFKDIKLVAYTRRNSEKHVDMKFVEGLYGEEDIMSVDDNFAHRAISCEVFGYPKPVVSIEDKDGRSIPTVKLKQASSMSSHVISSLEGIQLDEAVGKYKCIATSGNRTISKTIEVKKMIRPEILMAEVVVNNTEEIIAFCVARGQPAPKVSFSVNFASYTKIEKRPLLEVESTIQHSTVSRYSQKGGLSVDKWFEHEAERCPKPEYFSQTSVQEHHDVTKTMIAVKPLPYLSRHQVRVLYCTAEGYDNVYTTTKVTSKVFSKMKMFMKAAKAVSFMHVFG